MSSEIPELQQINDYLEIKPRKLIFLVNRTGSQNIYVGYTLYDLIKSKYFKKKCLLT